MGPCTLVLAVRKLTPTQDMVDPVSRSAAIAGTAVFTAVESRKEVNWASANEAKMMRTWRFERRRDVDVKVSSPEGVSSASWGLTHALEAPESSAILDGSSATCLSKD